VKKLVLTKIVFRLIEDKFQVSPSLVRFFKFAVYFKSKSITQTSQENSILKSFKEKILIRSFGNQENFAF